MNCTFDEATFPYHYKDHSGKVIEHGYLMKNVTLLNNQGTVDLCMFNSTNCDETKTINDNLKYSFLPPMVTFFTGYAIGIYLLKTKSKKLFEYEGTLKRFNAGGDEEDSKPTLSPTKSKILGLFLTFLYIGAIVALVLEASIMPASIQETLPPADRIAQLAMENFLAPIEEIFSFLEDTMTVKVGYAVAALKYSELNVILHIGILGGIISGLVAFVSMIFIAYFRPAAAAILNPSHDSNQIFINDGCSLVPTTPQLLKHARIYFILIAASWIPKFAMKSIVGFLVGTGSFLPFLISALMSATVPISIWFLLKSSETGLTALGLAYGAQDWIQGILFLSYFIYSKSLRNKYKIKCLWQCGSNNDDGDDIDNIDDSNNDDGDDIDNIDDSSINDSSIYQRSWKLILKDLLQGGLQLMLVDLAVQLSITITIYIAASQHLSLGYKLAASQAAYWKFGPSYLIGINLLLKIIGSRLIGSGQSRKYLAYFFLGLMLTICMSIGAVWLSISYGSNIAYDYGSSACVFGGSLNACSSIYANIFLGKDSLSNLLSYVFGPTVGLQMIFMFLRCALATCHDFAFLAKAAWACFIFGYIPSILFARYVENTASSYFVAMYVPHCLMILIFTKRMYSHVQCILNDKRGPWTEHLETMERNRSKSSLSINGNSNNNKNKSDDPGSYLLSNAH